MTTRARSIIAAVVALTLLGACVHYAARAVVARGAEAASQIEEILR